MGALQGHVYPSFQASFTAFFLIFLILNECPRYNNKSNITIHFRDCSKKLTVWHVCPLKTPLKWCSECRWGLDLPIPAAFAGLGIWQCQVGSGWQFLVQQFPFVLTPDPHGSSEHSKPRVSPCLYSPVTHLGWTLGRDFTFAVFSCCFLTGRWKRNLVWGSCKVSHVCINRSAEHIG